MIINFLNKYFKMETLKVKNLSFDARCELIAQVVFAANRQYIEYIGGRAINPSWEEAHEEHRQSLIKAIKSLITDPRTPESNHEAWCEARKSEGWKLDKVYNSSKKTHPNLIPYRELPFEEQLKDHLFMGIASIFVSGLEMYKMPEFTGEMESVKTTDEAPDPPTIEELTNAVNEAVANDDLAKALELATENNIRTEELDQALADLNNPLPPTEDLTDTQKADTENNDALAAASEKADEQAAAPTEETDKSSTEAKAPAEDKGEKVETAEAPKKKSKPKSSK
jgi:hypothetical protein